MPKISVLKAYKDNYIWLLHNGDRVVAVDPGDAAPVQTFLEQEQLTLVAILITHRHWDHVNGVEALVDEWDCPVWGPAKEEVPRLTHPLYEGDTVEVEGMRFTVIEVPGHTLGHIAYFGEGLLLIGDTLFASGCGRMFEGTPEQMQHSLAKLVQLPPDTLVYCAHEYTLANLAFARTVEPENAAIIERERTMLALRERDAPTIPTRLGDELETNPFLRWDSPVIRKVTGAATPAAVFATVRRWKDSF